METQSKTTAKDFFINLGAIVALYATVGSLVNLLFTVIDTAYPKITSGYNYMGSSSISWPVATLIIFFPIFIFLMWLLERDYRVNPEKQSSGIHRWLTYITLFIAGLTIAIDLITILYFFLDGQELTTGFILKVLILLVIAGGIFSYYLSDVLGKLTHTKRNIYRIASLIIIIGSIAWGFSVLGSPATQRLYKYDEQKISDLQNLNSDIQAVFYNTKTLPNKIEDLSSGAYYFNTKDLQTDQPYEYQKTSDTNYNICAVFNKQSENDPNKNYMNSLSYPTSSWVHPAGHYCFEETVSSVNANTNFQPYPTNPVPIY